MLNVKKPIVAVVVGLLTGALALLWPGINLVLNSATAAWNDEVEQSLPFEARVQLQRGSLAELDRAIAERAAAVIEADDLVRQRDGELEELNGQARAERGVLRQTRDLLDDGGNEYLIRGRKFTRSAVAADASRRSFTLSRLQGRIESLRQHIDRLRSALAEAKRSLDATREQRRLLGDQLDTLGDRKKVAEVLAQVHAIASDLRGQSDGPLSEIRGRMTRLRADVAATEGAAGTAVADNELDDVHRAIDNSMIPTDAIGRPVH